MTSRPFCIEFLYTDPLLPSGWYVIPMHPRRPQSPLGPFRDYRDCVRYIEGTHVR